MNAFKTDAENSSNKVSGCWSLNWQSVSWSFAVLLKKKTSKWREVFQSALLHFHVHLFFPPLYCISKPTQFHLSLHLECRYVRETIHLVKGYISVSYTVAQRQRFTVYNSCTPDTCRQKTSSLQLLRTHIVPSLGQKKKRLSCITLPEGLNTAGENLSTICACN